MFRKLQIVGETIERCVTGVVFPDDIAGPYVPDVVSFLWFRCQFWTSTEEREISYEFGEEQQVPLSELVQEGMVAFASASTRWQAIMIPIPVIKIRPVIVGIAFTYHPVMVFVERSLEPEGMIRSVPKQNPRCPC